MLGIDPDHPEQMLDALAHSLGIDPEQFKQLPETLINIVQSIDNRLSAVQADIATLKARLEEKDQSHVRPDNSAAARNGNGTSAGSGTASPASGTIDNPG